MVLFKLWNLSIKICNFRNSGFHFALILKKSRKICILQILNNWSTMSKNSVFLKTPIPVRKELTVKIFWGQMCHRHVNNHLEFLVDH